MSKPAYRPNTTVLISLFVIAVLVNYPWELGQAPLYIGLESYDRAVLWHCFVASVGDGIMVLLIVAVGLDDITSMGLV